MERISLSPRAIEQINESLTSGKDVQIAVRNHKLLIWEQKSQKKYEVVVASPHRTAL